jgi:hypothetical protein
MARNPTINKKQELIQQREAIDAKLAVLEEKAGIVEAVKRAHEGPPIPCGVLKERPPLGTPEMEQEHLLYFDDQHDHIRDGLRRAYFSVQDVAPRRQLIALQVDRAKVIRLMDEHEIAERRRELQQVEQKATDYPWAGAAIRAIAAVGGGAAFFGLTGAIAGAVAGFFWVRAMAASVKKEAEFEVKRANELLAAAEKGLRDEALRPEFFSALEAATGQEDQRFAGESAMANRVHARTGTGA